MVVYEPVESVQAAHARAIDERQSRRRGHHHAVTAQRDVGDVIGQQAVPAAHDLPRLGAGIEQRQAVGGGYRGAVVQRVGHNAVDAEQGVVLVVFDAVESGRDDIQPVVEIAHPQASAAHRQSGNVAIGQ